MFTFGRSLVIALAFAVGSCDAIVGSDDDNFTFDSIQAEFEEGMVDEADAVGGIRTIQVDGFIILPHPCHEVIGDLTRVGANVDIMVTATPTSTTCTGEIRAIQYRVQTFAVSRGVHRVRVFHEIKPAQRRLINQIDVSVG